LLLATEMKTSGSYTHTGQPHLHPAQVVDLDLAGRVGRGEPLAVLAGRQQVDRLSGTWRSHTHTHTLLSSWLLSSTSHKLDFP